MLVDDIHIILEGGNGGDGCVSFGPSLTAGPDGGNGGKGGNVYIVGTDDLRALNQFTQKGKWKADNGNPGEKKKMFGKAGNDLEIRIPVGTQMRDEDSGQVWEVANRKQRFMIVLGGAGGRGNWEFRSPTNTTPKYAEPGFAGQRRQLHLVMRYLAEYGLIGLPNAGKSSLLNDLTNAKAKVAEYPFTTLEPNLGVLNGKIIADIPGLIEGAASGKGLGIKFLKHIEKVGLLLHCIAADSEDVMRDYEVINKELAAFDAKMAQKKQIILLTKIDLIDVQTVRAQVKKLKKLGHEIFVVSVLDSESLERLKVGIGGN